MHLVLEVQTLSECWHAKRNAVVAAGMPTVNSLLSFSVNHQSQQTFYPVSFILAGDAVRAAGSNEAKRDFYS